MVEVVQGIMPREGLVVEVDSLRVRRQIVEVVVQVLIRLAPFLAKLDQTGSLSSGTIEMPRAVTMKV